MLRGYEDGIDWLEAQHYLTEIDELKAEVDRLAKENRRLRKEIKEWSTLIKKVEHEQG